MLVMLEPAPIVPSKIKYGLIPSLDLRVSILMCCGRYDRNVPMHSNAVKTVLCVDGTSLHSVGSMSIWKCKLESYYTEYKYAAKEIFEFEI